MLNLESSLNFNNHKGILKFPQLYEDLYHTNIINGFLIPIPKSYCLLCLIHYIAALSLYHSTTPILIQKS